MNGTLLYILVFVVICLITFGIIKLVCKNIKTSTAILLILPTISTCGIALIIYKIFNNTTYVSNSTYGSGSNQYYENIYDSIDSDKEVKKKNKVAKSYTDNFGKTIYYDEEGNVIGEGFDNGLGKTTYTDESGNYQGESINNNLGDTLYKDKNGNVVTNTTNYIGEDSYDNNTSSTKDDFGNKYYN